MRSTLIYGAALAGLMTVAWSQLAEASYPPQTSVRPYRPEATTDKPLTMVAERSTTKGRPPGWSQGEKTGWGSGKRPPGQRK
jgi:hypothetical protein